jgi:hypothetical protein
MMHSSSESVSLKSDFLTLKMKALWSSKFPTFRTTMPLASWSEVSDWLWKTRLYNHSECQDLLTQPHSTALHMTWIFTLVSQSDLKSAYSTVCPNHGDCQHSVHKLWRYLLNAILFWNTHRAFSVSSTKILATIMFEYKNLLWCYIVLLSE